MKFILLLLLFILGGCTHALHQVHLSDYDMKAKPNAGKRISSTGEQTVVMSFVFDTNYVNQARNKLIAKCPKGEIKNIMTRYSTSHGFFHWTNKVYMEGTCYK